MNEKTRSHLHNAHQRLQDAEGLFPLARYAGTVSRTYYAMFEAASAILASQGFEFDSHQGVISKFGELLVKTGRIESKFGRHLSRGFKLREDADYALDARAEIPLHAAEAELQKAREFVTMAEEFVEKHGELEGN
jgi:hypothetical protein